jgi:hypothetical protein
VSNTGPATVRSRALSGQKDGWFGCFQLFPELGDVRGAGDWLLVLKAASGLTRVGVLAQSVSGPVANLSLGNVKVLRHKRVEDFDEFSP